MIGAGLLTLARAGLGRIGKALAAVPPVIWLCLIAVAVIGGLLWRLDAVQQREAALKTWQAGVVQSASVAFGEPDGKGRYPVLAPGAIVPAITAAGNSIRDLRDEIMAQNAAIATTAADGAERRAVGKSAAADYDATKPRHRFTPAPVSPDTDATEALQLGREAWSELR